MSDQISPEATPSKGIPKWAIVVGVLLVILLVAGYAVQKFVIKKVGQELVEKAVELKTGAKVKFDDSGSFKVQGKDGAFEVGQNATWPASIPSDIPKFTGGSITAAVQTDNQQGKGWAVVVQKVEKSEVDAYVSALQNQGWKLTGQVTAGIDMSQLEKNTWQISVVYDATSKGLNISLQEKPLTE